MGCLLEEGTSCQTNERDVFCGGVVSAVAFLCLCAWTFLVRLPARDVRVRINNGLSRGSYVCVCASPTCVCIVVSEPQNRELPMASRLLLVTKDAARRYSSIVARDIAALASSAALFTHLT